MAVIITEPIHLSSGVRLIDTETGTTMETLLSFERTLGEALEGMRLLADPDTLIGRGFQNLLGTVAVTAGMSPAALARWIEGQGVDRVADVLSAAANRTFQGEPNNSWNETHPNHQITRETFFV